ncbi:hypothetical protein LWI28_023641 [Acer negundo]|uniref:PGG domain-containing protein n=1 Tax=Acer negundo TaxID=4023 RepID=A0AAD5P406_ACENE|nr:hypothetical protein LWI28_023641 [Acer negundo]
MEAATVEMIDAAAGSESYINNNIIEENFELLDSVYSAAADGDIDKFQQHAGVLDQILTPYGNTILHIHITARNSQNMDFVREILEMCPELLLKTNKKGETLLHMVARHGHADVAKYLLQECKKPYQNDSELGIKNTRQIDAAVKYGTENKGLDFMERRNRLKDEGASATSQMLQMINEAKDTALHEAVRYNHLDVVKVLTVEDPELPYAANNAGETPLYLAAKRGYADVLQEILSTCISPVDHGPCSRTALHATVIRNNIGITTLLVDDRRVNKSKQDEQGRTPLHLAALLGRIVIAKKLINEDKSAAYKADNKGKTPLHLAAGFGRVGIMRELISRCPGCCELVDNRGWNVFHFASTSKNSKAVELILRYPSLGNLLNEKDEKGNTPFLQAASMNFIITNPKMDLLVFNNENHNAADIVDEHSLKPLNRLLWGRISARIMRCRRILVKEDKDEEGWENEGNPVRLEKNYLVIATLIATVTFAAGITVPGGLIADKGPDQGAPILTRKAAFQAFVILNAISMFWSSYAILTHLTRSYTTNRKKIIGRRMILQGFIGYAMLAMIGAFLAGTCAVLLHSDKKLAISACVVPVVVFVLYIRLIDFSQASVLN